MKRRTCLFSTGFGILAVLAVLVSNGVQPAWAQTFDWKLQSVWSTPATNDGLKLFADNVKKETNGKVNIKVYGANELVKIEGTLAAVQSGAIQMACSAGPYNAGQIPEANVEFGLPFTWRNWGEAWEAWTKYGLRELIQEAYAEKGLRLITIQPASEYVLMSTKPVRKVEDLKGLKIRVVGLTAKVYQELGASPVNVPGAEQYVALQRGTADATVYPVFVLDAYKLKEVIKCIVMPSVISPPTTELFMNLDLWKGLPKDVQEGIERACSQHQAVMDERYLNEAYVAVGSFLMKGIGEAVVLPEAEVKKIRKVAAAQWQELAKKSERMKKLIDAMNKFMADKGLSVN